MAIEDEIQFPEGYPEEHKAHVRAEVARRSMDLQAQHMMMKRFFNETLDVDGAGILKGILSAVSATPTLAGYWEGYMARLIEDRFDLCPGCGKSHDSDLNAALIEHGVVAPTQVASHPTMEGPQTLPNLVTETDPGLTENPDMPGFNMLGDRLASCPSCNGDRTIPICEHPSGSHGQGRGGGRECPEPTLAPCPECRTPDWYERNSLIECPKGSCPEGELVPLEEPGVLACAQCGVRYAIQQFDPEV